MNFQILKFPKNTNLKKKLLLLGGGGGGGWGRWGTRLSDLFFKVSKAKKGTNFPLFWVGGCGLE